jgi:hypothetical protein
MLFEIFAFWGLICLILFVFAEMKKENQIFGVFGAILLMLLGVIVFSDNIQITTGHTDITSKIQIKIGVNSFIGFNNATNDSSSTNTSINGTTNLNTTKTISSNQTSSNLYTTVSISYINFSQFFGFLLVIIGLALLVKYVFLIIGYEAIN